MEIDWITVSAQVVNFLVLVYLLKRFLYGPIIRAMDSREQRISTRLEEAQAREQDAEDKADAYERKREELEKQKDERLEQAQRDAEAKRKKMIEEAREEVEQMRQEWRDDLEREKREFLRKLRDEAQRQITQVLRHVLDDLAERELEQEIVRVFIKRLAQLDEETRALLGEHDGALEVLTAFELDADNQRAMNDALAEVAGEGAAIEFKRSDDLTCGIALRAGGRKIAWSVDEHLDALEERMQETLEGNRSR